ncbi:hypothetical protein GOV12_01800 [Candidatus Pacearchaeota archaeon]|nr:hypothetical protein [Candidatus Pacearchaeota archaeon]
MVKKSVPKRHKIVEKKKLGKKRILLIQAFVTLLIAGFLIMSGIGSDNNVTGNVVGSSDSGAMKIFVLLGVAIGVFSFIEIVILFVVSYF